jgi:hypothetical protein
MHMTETTAQGQDEPQALQALLMRSAVDAALRQRLLDDPVAVLNEHGVQVPDGVAVHVLENNGSVVHLLLPPLLTDRELSEADLAAIAGGAGSEAWSGLAAEMGSSAQQYQAITAQAAAFHNQFVQTLGSAGGAYGGR